MNLRLAPAWLALLLALPCAAALAAPKEKARDELLVLFGQRRVTLAVPAGFVFSSDKDERGLITARLADPKEKITLEISFLPDTDGEAATPRGRKEFLVQTFQRYVAASVEQAMQFEELEPRAGAGTYCVFTDQDLVGKTKLPPRRIPLLHHRRQSVARLPRGFHAPEPEHHVRRVSLRHETPPRKPRRTAAHPPALIGPPLPRSPNARAPAAYLASPTAAAAAFASNVFNAASRTAVIETLFCGTSIWV